MPNRARRLNQSNASIRESSSKRGYDRRWRKARLEWLHMSPVCVRCLEAGKVEPATEVDHITPHRGSEILFWDINNWQSLCKTCHSRKTRLEDMR